MGTVREESRIVSKLLAWMMMSLTGLEETGGVSGRDSGKMSSSALVNWTLKYLWDFYV